MSLRNRLLAVVVSLLAAAVLTVGVGLSFYSRDTVLHQAENDGQLLANVLSRSIVVSQNVESAAEDIIAKDLVTSAQIVAQFVAVAERYRMTPAAMTSARMRRTVSDMGCFYRDSCDMRTNGER